MGEKQAVIVRKDNDLSQIVSTPLQYLKSAVVQSKEWTLMVVNSILTEKLIADIEDEHDMRPQ